MVQEGWTEQEINPIPTIGIDPDNHYLYKDWTNSKSGDDSRQEKERDSGGWQNFIKVEDWIGVIK